MFEWTPSPPSIGMVRVSNESSLPIGRKSWITSSLTRPPGLKVKSPTRKPSIGGGGSCAAGGSAAGAPSGAGAASCADATPAAASSATNMTSGRARRACDFMGSPLDIRMGTACRPWAFAGLWHQAAGKPAARGVFVGEVFDRDAAVMRRGRRNHLPRRLADDGDPGDSLAVPSVPQRIGIEPGVVVPPCVALDAYQDPDLAEPRDRRGHEAFQLVPIGLRDRASHGRADQTRGLAPVTQHHATNLTARAPERLCGSGRVGPA